ncbi:energy-coupled thiamine transporter ThiT [Natronospora cellulosivora (SeqCode)]
MRDKKLRMMTEIGLAVALAVVLNFMTLFRMPQGGSVNLEMLPILIVAIRWGGIPGMLTGFVYGLVQLALNPYVVHPVQFILDYPFAYMLLGIAGFIPVKLKASKKIIVYGTAFIALFLGTFARFISHLLSGAIFFAHFAPEGQNVWLYSSIYNASFLIPSLLIAFVIIVPLLKTLMKVER